MPKEQPPLCGCGARHWSHPDEIPTIPEGIYSHGPTHAPTVGFTDAALHLAAVLDDNMLPDQVGPSLTCSEVDAIAAFLARAGRPLAAEAWVDGHSLEDEVGDSHLDFENGQRLRSDHYVAGLLNEDPEKYVTRVQTLLKAEHPKEKS